MSRKFPLYCDLNNPYPFVSVSGDKLRQIREGKGLSAENLARGIKACGGRNVCPSEVKYWEDHNRVPVIILVPLCTALEIDIRALKQNNGGEIRHGRDCEALHYL